MDSIAHVLAQPTDRTFLNRKRYILIFTVSIAVVIAAVCVYLEQLSITVSSDLMASVNEISSHDVESVEGSLDNAYGRLDSAAKRMAVYDVQTVQEAQEQMNLEAASSSMFNAIYLLDTDGILYSSSYARFNAGEHAYDEMFADGRDNFVMLYDDAYGKLETTKESLIYGVRMDGMTIGDHQFVAMLGRSDLSAIRDQLLIESFDGQGISSVINPAGYYIVSAAPATDLSGRNNFYDLLDSSFIEDGLTTADVRRNISEGRSFVIHCVTAHGERQVISFEPIEGTSWSFIMTVPTSVFEQRFSPFIFMTACMLVALVLVLIVMMVIIYRFMKRSIRANAEAAARAEFLSNMSHEIRTPLNGIIGLNHLMERHLDDNVAIAGYVQKMNKAAQYLLSLVNDILDVSKLQAGKVDLARERFSLRAALDNVCEMQREPIAEAGIKLDTSGVDLPHPEVIGDEVRVSQVLMNILSNAVKFTPDGGSITITADQTVLNNSRNVFTRISIADTGCGMTPEFQRQIFDTFTQERNAISESQKGTGLGMSISHLLVQQMGGQLSVESKLGRGSRFTVAVALPMAAADGRLPGGAAANAGAEGIKSKAAKAASKERPDDAARDAQVVNAASVPAVPGESATEATGTAAPNKTATEAAAPDDRPLNLLIAEDNDLNADILSSILTEEGHEVTIATNGQEAVDAFAASAEGAFDAILMDAQMPVMDGYDAAKAIRQLDRADSTTVRIFACTASTLVEDRERALESGMDDFLPKPLNMRVMLEKLGSVRKEQR